MRSRPLTEKRAKISNATALRITALYGPAAGLIGLDADAIKREWDASEKKRLDIELQGERRAHALYQRLERFRQRIGKRVEKILDDAEAQYEQMKDRHEFIEAMNSDDQSFVDDRAREFERRGDHALAGLLRVHARPHTRVRVTPLDLAFAALSRRESDPAFDA